MPLNRDAARVALAAVAAYALFAAVFLAANSWNPEWFVHFGHESTILPKGEQVLGSDVLIPHEQGQDGQSFWLIARDPLLVHTSDAETYLDRPAYRSQRLLYPLLAAPFRVLGERAMIWALLVLNLAAVGLGTYWTALLVAEVGAPARAALAFPFNPGVLVGLVLDTSDVLALALLVGGVLAWVRRDDRWALTAFALAGLTKEITLLAPLALAAMTLRHDARRAVRTAVVVVAPAALWALYVRVRLSWPPSQIEEVGAPLRGFIYAWRYGWSVFGDWGHAAVAIGQLLVMVALVGVWWRRRRNALLVAALPFALLYPFLSAQVVDLVLNSLRASAPALTLFAVALYARREVAA